MRSESASPYLREPAGTGLGAGILLLVLVGFAAASGMMIAMGELQAMYVSLALIACLAVLYDFRVGAVLLVVLLPFSHSSLFPHELMGMRGLNPVNLLVLGTAASFVLHGGLGRLGRMLPVPLLLVYVPPIVAAGLIGMRHVDDIYPLFYELMLIDFLTPAAYLRDMLLKPMLIVVVAMMLAAAVAHCQKPDRFLTPLLVAIWVLCIVALGFVALSGVALAELAGADARGFFSALGLHANDLGRLFLMAYALLLFSWYEAKQPGFRSVALITLLVTTLALVLTFSRAAYLGFAVVNALFLLWKLNARTLAFAIAALAVSAAFMPEPLQQRIMLGFGSGDVDELTAGRVRGIWLPLLPEIARTPLWGNGIGSIMWSTPMVTEGMLPTTHPHNAYLQALLDTGVIGLALMLAFYLTVWRGFRRLGSNAYVSPELRGFFQGAAAGLVAFLVTGWAGSSLMPAREWVFLWVAIGMMYGMLARRPSS